MKYEYFLRNEKNGIKIVNYNGMTAYCLENKTVSVLKETLTLFT